MTAADKHIIRWLGLQDYQTAWEAMQAFTNQRDANTVDEIWLLAHPPVFTQGQNGKPEHILKASDIPIVQTDRGGQITYHGPGQLMIYTLIDLQRKKLNVRAAVTLLENAVIGLLAEYHIQAYADKDAPGVYVNKQKICSIGLRIRRGRAYHGLALNVDMDLTPFTLINPCGYTSLKMTQLKTLGGPTDLQQTGQKLMNYLIKSLGYTNPTFAMSHD